FVETLGPAQLSVRAEPELRLAEPDVNRVAAAEVMEVGRAEAATAEADAEVVGADASAAVGAEVAPNGTVSAREARVSTRPWREDGRALGAIRLRGLRPDTAYTVRAGNATGTLRTAPVEAEQLSFIVYGDNRTQHQQHRAVVRAVAAEPNVRFILHTGDLVEMGGRATDWDTAFEISSELFRRTPIFPSLGNHEIYGPGESGRAAYHRHLVPPGARVAYYDRRFGPVRIVALDSNEPFDEDSAQLRWLRRRLDEGSDARFTFVVLHHGPISSGRHGGHEGMREQGVPELLRDAGVDLVFSGHDHMYERGDSEGYRYIVSGGGGAPLYGVNRRLESQLAFVPAYHYLRIDIDGEELRMTAKLPEGETLEACELSAGGWRCEGGSARGPIAEGEPPEGDWGLLRSLAFAGVSFLGLFLLWRSRKRRRAGK
ncbi:MAG: metallophosphoesterase, partial [Myxococcota bacterium]